MVNQAVVNSLIRTDEGYFLSTEAKHAVENHICKVPQTQYKAFQCQYSMISYAWS